MKRLLTCIASLLFVSNLMIMAQFPDVTVPSKKYVSDIGNELRPLQNKNGKCGFINKEGKYYIKPVFNEVTPFEKRWYLTEWFYLASVRRGDKWKLIRDNGEYFPNSEIAFDSKPTFISEDYVICETNKQLYKYKLSDWKNSVPYEKITLDDKSVLLPMNEKDRGAQVYDNKSHIFKNNLYILRPQKRIERIFEYYFDTAHKDTLILKGYDGYYLADKNFNALSKSHDYLHVKESLVVGMKRNGDGIIYKNGMQISFKLKDTLNKKKKSTILEEIINYKYLLDLLTESQQTTELLQVQDNLYEIIREGKYGLIDISSNLYIKPEYEYSIYNTNGRYTTEGNDIIIHDKYLYTISEYEKMRYEKISNLNSLNWRIRYDLHVQEYTQDSLLTMVEKKHYEQLVSELEKWSKAVSIRDDELFSNGKYETYISTTEIPQICKKYLACAEKLHDEAEEIHNANRDLNDSDDFYERNNNCDYKKYDIEEDTEKWNGKYYTHIYYSCNGFRFRDNAITKETEIRLNDAYIPLSKISKDSQYNQYALYNSIAFSDYTLYTYRKSYQVIDGVDMFSIMAGGGPAYFTSDRYDIDMIICDTNGNIKIHKNVAFELGHLKFRKDYFYKNIIAKRKVKGKDDKTIADNTMLPINTRVKDDSERDLISAITIYDYKLNPLTYLSKEGEIVHDIIKWNNKWVFVGSTINEGYVDWENPHIILLDSKLKVITSSSLPLKGHRLTVNKQTIYEDANKALVIPDWVKIKHNNTIEWLK